MFGVDPRRRQTSQSILAGDSFIRGCGLPWCHIGTVPKGAYSLVIAVNDAGNRIDQRRQDTGPDAVPARHHRRYRASPAARAPTEKARCLDQGCGLCRDGGSVSERQRGRDAAGKRPSDHVRGSAVHP